MVKLQDYSQICNTYTGDLFVISRVRNMLMLVGTAIVLKDASSLASIIQAP